MLMRSALALCLLLSATAAVAQTTIVVDGRRTLAEAIRIALDGRQPVTISVAPGVHHGTADIYWKRGAPPITIVGRGAVFEGDGKGQWLLIRAAFGEPLNLTIRGLEVRNYRTAVYLTGNRENPDAWNSKTTIEGNRFINIGALTQGSETGYGAILLVNSRENLIKGNIFTNIRNLTGCAYIHSVYMAHHSSYNVIRENAFDGGCGDTIKVRDDSNDNLIESNTFSDQQTGALFRDSYCDKTKQSDCTKKNRECPSWRNTFRNNTYRVEVGEKRPRVATVAQPTNGEGCPDMAAPRLLESGNFRKDQ